MKSFSVFMIALSIGACLFLGYSCKSRTSDATLNVLADQVMEIHDEVMPKMGTIHQIKKKLSNKSAEILDAESENMSESLKQIAELQKSLDASEDQMMNWMRSFDKDWAAKPSEEAKLYLTEEKKRITEVKNLMLESIANAEKFLRGN